MIEVIKVDSTDRKQVKQYVNFPFQLYKRSKHWVPPLRREMRKVMDKAQHPYYEHSQADFFLARSQNKTLGRITAIFNQKLNEFNNSRTASFYHFDCIDDPAVSHALFNKTFDWARDKGAQQVIGPRGLLQGDGIGLLIDGFSIPPAMGIPYNYHYYENLIESAGFSKKSDYFSGYLETSTQLPEQVFRVAKKVKERKGFYVKNFQSKSDLLQEAPRIRQVYNEAFSGSEGFRPITEEEMKVIANQMLSIADPRLIKLVFQGDNVIGFLFAYPNVWRGLQKSKGMLWPFGWFHLWRDMRSTKWVDVNGIGILPRHQGWGASAVLYIELEKTIRDFGFKHAETVQIREDNTESIGEHRLLNVEWYKTHRVYHIGL